MKRFYIKTLDNELRFALHDLNCDEIQIDEPLQKGIDWKELTIYIKDGITYYIFAIQVLEKIKSYSNRNRERTKAKAYANKDETEFINLLDSFKDVLEINIE